MINAYDMIVQERNNLNKNYFLWDDIRTAMFPQNQINSHVDKRIIAEAIKESLRKSYTTVNKYHSPCKFCFTGSTTFIDD